MTTPPSKKYSKADTEVELLKLRHLESLIEATEAVANIGHYEWDYQQDRLASCSEEYARIFNMTIAEVMESQSNWTKTLSQIHPEDLEHYAACTQSLQETKSLDINYRIVLDDNEIKHIREVGILIVDESGVETGSFGIVQDISQQVKHERDLEYRDELAGQVESIIDIGHFIFDVPSEKYTYISEGFARIYGTTPEVYMSMMQSVEEDLSDVHPDDRKRVAEQYDRFDKAAEEYTIEFRIFRADGEMRWVREHGEAKLTLDNQVLQTLGVAQDITEQKLAEEEIIRTRDTLEQKNTELERFTYTVSHDLKSPLVTVKGFLGMLEKDIEAGEKEAIAKDIDFLNAATETMGELLSDLLELSRVGMAINPSTLISMTDLCNEVVHALQGSIKEHHAEINIMPDMPNIYADPGRIKEVIQNLLENAIKFSRDSDLPKINIYSETRANSAMFIVEDNGIGIESAYHDKVFLLFERLDAGVEGTGVGLALVKRIVETHGGEIWIESPADLEGSRFCFTLPYSTPESNVTQPLPAS